MKKGLTLGKYAPLHRGHQLVIETDLSEMDEMVVIIYDAPDITTIPLPVRSGWIRSLYPKVKVIEAWDGPTEVGYGAALMRAHERYVIDTLGVKEVTHFYGPQERIRSGYNTTSVNLEKFPKCRFTGLMMEKKNLRFQNHGAY